MVLILFSIGRFDCRFTERSVPTSAPVGAQREESREHRHPGGDPGQRDLREVEDGPDHYNRLAILDRRVRALAPAGAEAAACAHPAGRDDRVRPGAVFGAPKTAPGRAAAEICAIIIPA